MSSAALTPAFGYHRRPARARQLPARVAAAEASRTRSARSGPTRTRLTRRGRLVLVVAFVALALALLTVFGTTSAATGESGEPLPTHAVVVEPGDTLWGIAADVAAPGEVQAMVHHIRELNALPGSALSVGEELAVPVGP